MGPGFTDGARICRRGFLSGVSASVLVAALPAVSVSAFDPIVWEYPATWYGHITFHADGTGAGVWSEHAPLSRKGSGR
jgi:hypothetical protein